MLVGVPETVEDGECVLVPVGGDMALEAAPRLVVVNDQLLDVVGVELGRRRDARKDDGWGASGADSRGDGFLDDRLDHFFKHDAPSFQELKVDVGADEAESLVDKTTF